MRGPHRGDAAVLGPAEALEVSVAAQIRQALRELASLAEKDRGLVPGPEALAATLSALEVYAGTQSPAAVTVGDPLALRARRVRALILLGCRRARSRAPARPSRS